MTFGDAQESNEETPPDGRDPAPAAGAEDEYASTSSTPGQEDSLIINPTTNQDIIALQHTRDAKVQTAQHLRDIYAMEFRGKEVQQMTTRREMQELKEKIAELDKVMKYVDTAKFFRHFDYSSPLAPRELAAGSPPPPPNLENLAFRRPLTTSSPLGSPSPVPAYSSPVPVVPKITFSQCIADLMPEVYAQLEQPETRTSVPDRRSTTPPQHHHI